MKWTGTRHVLGRGKVHTGFRWGHLRDRDRLEELDVDGMVILKCIFKKCGREAWTGLLWLGTGTGGGLL